MSLNYLLDFAADNPQVLSDVLLAAPPRYFARVFERLAKHRDQAVQRLSLAVTTPRQQSKLTILSEVSEQTLAQLSNAVGSIGNEYAFCQQMPLTEFESFNDKLAHAGFRLTRLRPFRVALTTDHSTSSPVVEKILVAAVWNRNQNRNQSHWRHIVNASKTGIGEAHDQAQADGLVMIDAAGYLHEEDGQLVEKYCAVWSPPAAPFEEKQQSKYYLGIALGQELESTNEAFAQSGYGNTQSLHSFIGSDGKLRLTSVVNRFSFKSQQCVGMPLETGILDSHLDLAQWDISLTDPAIDSADLNALGSSDGDAESNTLATANKEAAVQVTAAWFGLPGSESRYLIADNRSTYLKKIGVLENEGYVPAAVSTQPLTPGSPYRLASVWQRYSDQKLAPQLATRRATAATALLMLNEPGLVWPMLEQSNDPSVRSLVLEYAAQQSVSPQCFSTQLATESNPSIVAALILAIGNTNHATGSPQQYMNSDVRSSELAAIESRKLLNLFENSVDPFVHSAAEWTLRRCGFGSDVDEVCHRLATGKVMGNRHWYVSTQNDSMLIHDNEEPVLVGSPRDERYRIDNEMRHLAHIDRTIAIASKEVTVEQFQRFKDEVQVSHFYDHEQSPDPSCPQPNITWYEAAQYCRWLSEQEGVPESEMCYPSIAEIKPGMIGIQNYADCHGYRLPSEHEWEWACRGGTSTVWHWGVNEELASRYAWLVSSSGNRTWPVGRLMPNQFGLFDIAGNAFEQTHEPGIGYTTAAPSLRPEETMIRGGVFYSPTPQLRSAFRYGLDRSARGFFVGVRIVRTM